VAAGNHNSDSCYYSPAFVPNAITVGSTTSMNERSGFSGYGSCVNIWAPGSGVLSAGHSSDTASSTQSGTSMATPHVAGAAALVLEADPSKKSSAVLQELLDTAVMDDLTFLMPGDTNALLYVGEGGPLECPSATSTGPNAHGDCRCNPGSTCYENGSYGCTFSYTFGWGYKSGSFFLPSCSDCSCQ